MSLLALEDDRVTSNFHCAPFQLKHKLADHPLFALPRLVQLARSMPRDRIEYNSGKVSVNQRPEDIPQLDMPADEVIRRIKECDAWMVIKGAEADPDYHELLLAFLADVSSAAGDHLEPFSDLQAFVFISSAGSTTPFHIDAEQNILVQIRGDKYVHVFDNCDRDLISEEAMEISPSKHRNQHYDKSFEKRADVFSLKAGDAVHIPYMWPHWVRTGDDYAISIAMTWKTPTVERLNKIRLMNGTLRRFGMVQKPPGARPVLDGIKVFAHDAARAVIDPLRRSENMRRVLRGLIYGRNANYYYGNTDEQRGA